MKRFIKTTRRFSDEFDIKLSDDNESIILENNNKISEYDYDELYLDKIKKPWSEGLISGIVDEVRIYYYDDVSYEATYSDYKYIYDNIHKLRHVHLYKNPEKKYIPKCMVDDINKMIEKYGDASHNEFECETEKHFFTNKCDYSININDYMVNYFQNSNIVDKEIIFTNHRYNDYITIFKAKYLICDNGNHVYEIAA